MIHVSETSLPKMEGIGEMSWLKHTVLTYNKLKVSKISKYLFFGILRLRTRRKYRVAIQRERGYTNFCRVRDEDWVPCDLSV